MNATLHYEITKKYAWKIKFKKIVRVKYVNRAGRAHWSEVDLELAV